MYKTILYVLHVLNQWHLKYYVKKDIHVHNLLRYDFKSGKCYITAFLSDIPIIIFIPVYYLSDLVGSSWVYVLCCYNCAIYKQSGVGAIAISVLVFRIRLATRTYIQGHCLKHVKPQTHTQKHTLLCMTT